MMFAEDVISAIASASATGRRETLVKQQKRNIMETDMTREEAINVVKERLNYYESEKRLRAACELLLPELRESEDERIRKEIIEYFKHYSGGDNISVRFPKWIAYLEKQKAKERLDRMAPIYNDKESFESALEKAWKYYNESASRKVDSFEDDYIECVFSKGFREGFLYREKQKEQEPAEWSDTDNIGWDEAFACVTRAEKAAKNEEELQNAITAEKWLKEIKFKYYVHPVKQEWSEKDKETFNNIIEKAKGGYWIEINEITWLIDCFKSLRPQPKQEWSEEDKKRIKQLIYDTEFIKAHYEKRKEELGEQFNNALIRDCDEQIAWLKSLRPPQYCENCKLKRSVENWKPSKEQIGALENARYMMSQSGDYYDTTAIIDSLIIDLQKLK